MITCITSKSLMDLFLDKLPLAVADFVNHVKSDIVISRGNKCEAKIEIGSSIYRVLIRKDKK